MLQKMTKGFAAKYWVRIYLLKDRSIFQGELGLSRRPILSLSSLPQPSPVRVPARGVSFPSLPHFLSNDSQIKAPGAERNLLKKNKQKTEAYLFFQINVCKSTIWVLIYVVTSTSLTNAVLFNKCCISFSWGHLINWQLREWYVKNVLA